MQAEALLEAPPPEHYDSIGYHAQQLMAGGSDNSGFGDAMAKMQLMKGGG